MTFGARLAQAMDERGPLCVGLDPDPQTLASWGLDDSVASLRAFATVLLDASEGVAACVKPNAAFFERHGSAGVAVLEEILATARGKGLLTILDAKRGDIGSTMKGYADSYLRVGAPLEADSVTLSPYLGFGSLAPALDLAAANGKGVFILALTSNPEGPQFQHGRTEDGRAVARVVAESAAELNRGAVPLGSVGLVVGATIGDAVRQLGIDLESVNGPLLSPGVGAQGAGPQEVRSVFGAAARAVVVNQSRGIASAGPRADDVRHAIEQAARAAQHVVRDADSQQ